MDIPPGIEHGFILVTGALFLAFGVSNARRDVTRRSVKWLSSKILGTTAARRLVDSFADTNVARAFYGIIATTAYVLMGAWWLFGGVRLVIADLVH